MTSQFYITASLHRPSFDGRHDAQTSFNYSHGQFEGEQRDAEIFDTLEDAKSAFDCADAYDFKGWGTLTIYLHNASVDEDGEVVNVIIDEKTIAIEE